MPSVRARRMSLWGLTGAALLLILGPMMPLTFAADTGSASASPGTAASNATINIAISATLGEVTPAGYYDIPFFVAVLTPSGTMYGCLGSSSACNLIGFTSSSSGTYTCTIPFGGTTASSLSVATTGGVNANPGDCSGSNSATWTGMSSSLCGGVYPSGVTCVGTAGFNALYSGCGGPTPFAVGFGTLPPSKGDTSQAGTYQVVVCWNFINQGASGGAVSTYVASKTSFQILSASGVPEFPGGMLAVVAIAIPAVLLLRARTARLRV